MKYLWLKLSLSGILILINFTHTFCQKSYRSNLLSYVSTLKKDDGGYGWYDQYDGHITPTYACIGILQSLQAIPDDTSKLVYFVKNHHPQTGVNKEAGPSGTELRNLTYQQIQSLVWLKANSGSFKEEITNWKSQAGKKNNYESNGFAVLAQEVMTPVCKNLLKLPLNDEQEMHAYLLSRRRENGSFNNAPAAYGGDGNILNTYYAIQTLKLLSSGIQNKEETIKWIQSCQKPDGSFTHQPKPKLGDSNDVIYTWAAIKALQELDAHPKNMEACINYLFSLANGDGGFGNKPGLPSTPMSAWYLVDALSALNKLSLLEKKHQVTRVNTPTAAVDLKGLKVYSVQFQAQGSGSPKEAVMLADSFKIDLWGAKNADTAWIAAAQKIANQQKVKVAFFHADEPYGKNIKVPGMGNFSHLLDYFAEANNRLPLIEDSSTWEAGSFHALKGKGGLIFQVSNNEPMARLLLDESVKGGGFIAISAHHFSQNFPFFLPYLYEYRHQIPFVALQDAHGKEAWWWGKELAGYRTLFVAKEPTYEQLLDAIEDHRVVAIRRDSVSQYRQRIMGGTDEVRNYIQENEMQWKWWQDGQDEALHPWAALTLLDSTDVFEAGKPDAGMFLRIRLLWSGTRQFLSKPEVKLEKLTVNNQNISVDYTETKYRNGVIADAYYLADLSAYKNTEVHIQAEITHLQSGKTKSFILKTNQNQFKSKR